MTLTSHIPPAQKSGNARQAASLPHRLPPSQENKRQNPEIVQQLWHPNLAFDKKKTVRLIPALPLVEAQLQRVERVWF